MKPAAVILAVLAVLGLALAGCGGKCCCKKKPNYLVMCCDRPMNAAKEGDAVIYTCPKCNKSVTCPTCGKTVEHPAPAAAGPMACPVCTKVMGDAAPKPTKADAKPAPAAPAAIAPVR